MKRALCCLSMVVCLLIVTDVCGRDQSQENALILSQVKEGAPPSTLKPIKEQGWDQILAAAKKEGTVVIYFAPNPTIQKNLADAFKQRYGIALEFITGRGAALSEKIFSERRAGLFLGDVIVQGYTAQFIFKPHDVLQPLDDLLVLPEVTNASNWADDRLPFLDRGHTIVTFIRSTEHVVMRNTQAVKAEEIKSYYDVLLPKWQGSIVMGDPTIAGVAQSWFLLMLQRILGMEKGADYMKQLVEQKPVITREDRAAVEGVARGKYHLAIGLHPPTVAEFRRMGAPVEPIRMMEGTPTTASMGNVSVLKQNPHPHATVVFLNWLLTKAGQTVFSQSLRMPSARVDVTTEGMDPYYVRQPGEKVFSNYEEELAQLRGKMAPKIKEIFAPLLK